MEHYIIVKLKDKSETKSLIPGIKEIFDKTLVIPGVNKVDIIPSNSERSNRHDIMIKMDVTPEGLEAYDASDAHAEWKRVYGDKIETKTIFDCE